MPISCQNLEIKINRYLEIQKRNAPYTEVATIARGKNSALFTECKERGYTHRTVNGYVHIGGS